MYHVETIDVTASDQPFKYCDTTCLFANNMKNTSNYYIRNLMTGLKKAPEELTQNEKDVIKTVSDAIPQINASLKAKYDAKAAKINADKKLSAKEKAEKTGKLKCLQFEMPTSENWFAGYNLLDAVFRQTKNADYTACHSHVIQNAIKDTTESWTSYFAGLKTYAPDSGHTGKPKIPGYKKKGGRSTAVFSNLACSIRHGLLSFPKMKETTGTGDTVLPENGSSAKEPKKKKKDKVFRLDVSSLPHASKDKLIEVRIVPCFGRYRIQIVTDDGLKEEDILPKETNIIGADGKPAGVMMLDPGLDNLAAITDNKGNTPIVIKGGAVKSVNRYYNKRMAFLKSEQMKGKDTKKYKPEPTKRMKSLSRKREAFLRDTFCKYAHFICRTMEERSLSYLIIGHNKGQKQNINIGHVNNQKFVFIPFAKFIQILKTVAASYGILVIEQEESYTSKACFGAKDPIPVYGKGDKVSFSGKRTKRGLYVQNDGKVMNADINGAANTGRKYDERIFPADTDTSYLYKTVKAYTYKDVLNHSHLWHQKRIAGQTA